MDRWVEPDTPLFLRLASDGPCPSRTRTRPVSLTTGCRPRQTARTASYLAGSLLRPRSNAPPGIMHFSNKSPQPNICHFFINPLNTFTQFVSCNCPCAHNEPSVRVPHTAFSLGENARNCPPSFGFGLCLALHSSGRMPRNDNRAHTRPDLHDAEP